MLFSEEAMEGYWTKALQEFKEHRYSTGEACLQAYIQLANHRKAIFKEAEETRQMNELRAQAGKYTKISLGDDIARFRACADKARSDNRLEAADVMDRTIARLQEIITMIDQLLQKLDESENLSNEKCGDETTGTA